MGKYAIKIFVPFALILLIVAFINFHRVRVLGEYITDTDIVSLTVMRIPWSPFVDTNMMYVHEYVLQKKISDALVSQEVRRTHSTIQFVRGDTVSRDSMYVVILWTNINRYIIHIYPGRYVVEDIKNNRNSFIAIEQSELIYLLDGLFYRVE